MTIASIYKTCKSVLDGLHLVPGFDQILINNNNNNNYNSSNHKIDPIITTPPLPRHYHHGDEEDIFSSLTLSLSTAINNTNASFSSNFQQSLLQSSPPQHHHHMSNPSHIPTPHYQLWELCRQGYILCSLFNLLKPEAAIDLTLEQDTSCRQHLSLNEDDLFTVSEMYQDNAIGFSKVINTLHKILTLLYERGILKSEYPPPSSTTTSSSSLSLSDQQSMTSSSTTLTLNTTTASSSSTTRLRDKVIIELLETERKYVEYLETTQNYAQELRSNKQRNIISLDTLHHIFGNLNALIDFQLRFLMQVEYHAEHPRENFGQVLTELEDAFSVYEPYCANMQHALDLVVQWAPQLSNSTSSTTSSMGDNTNSNSSTPNAGGTTAVDPNYDLPSLLIKPVQRVCKYPLLLQQLINYTPNDWPYYDDLQRGLEAMERVASKVNETRRLQENKQRVNELKKRVSDWKSITNVDEQCGALLLYDRATVHHKNTTKEVSIHLFEKVIMLCADVATKKAKKKKDTSGPLWILGLIKISNMAQVDHGAVPISLQIFWLKDSDLESFTLEYRNDEQVAQWESAIEKLIRQQTRSKRLSSLVTCGLESYHDQEDATATLSPTFLSYAYMNKLPVRGGYYDQIPELFDNNHHHTSHGDSGNHTQYESLTPTRTSSYSHYFYHYNNNNSSTSSHTSQHQQQQHGYYHNYNSTITNTPTATTTSNNNPHTFHLQPGLLPSPHSPSCSTPFSSSTSRSSSTCGPPSPPQSGSSPTSPYAVQTIYEMGPNAGTGIIEEKEQRHRRRITTSSHHQQHSTSSASQTHTTTTTRGRSQSSPNIGITSHPHSRTTTRTSTYNNNNNNNDTNNPHYHSTASQIIRKTTTVKVKLYYSRRSAFVFYAPRDINYQDLRTLAERKTRMKGLTGDFIKYRDEDGDLITIHCDDDIVMIFDSATRSDDAIHLFISTTS
ncbi:hypothetical protein BDA99DRAFT_584041 [Phascolomyces articulosus]|uniref:Uncharacterized protein n=1 Tax=Phascolomyces articulosus TaxID=60185 RepID=A0AAD5PJH4_9FUNG|nr:hypothetical protein BDA99DRAFT_584041 [Phascolomyces articulosus]